MSTNTPYASHTAKVLVAQLSEKPILAPDVIRTLRAQNSPQTFAQAVHKALDDTIEPIGLDNPTDFKLGILKNTVTRVPFCLHHGDVVAQYIRLPDVSSPSAQRMAQWLEKSHGVMVSPSIFVQGANSPKPTLPAAPNPAAPSPVAPSPVAPSPVATNTISITTRSPLNRHIKLAHHRRIKLARHSRIKLARPSLFAVGCLLLLVLAYRLWSPDPSPNSRLDLEAVTNLIHQHALRANANTVFPYSPRNLDKVRDWLSVRHSALSRGSYLETLDTIAKAWNVDLLLLIAITGQEQNFVPKNHPKAETIMANPFNVFGSWQAYNTRFEDAAAVATRTVAKLRADCPEDFNPYRWLNRRYAQDPLWWRGVQHFHLQLILSQSK